MCIYCGIGDLLESEFINEAKEIGKAKGKQSSSKLRQIKQLQSSPSFLRSMRAHSRAAAKRLDKKVNEFRSDLTKAIRKYNSGDLSFTKLKFRAATLLRGYSEGIFRLGSKSVGVTGQGGSLKKLTKFEKDWLTSYNREEVKYLNRFLNDVKQGESVRKTRERIDRYAQSIRSVYESGRIFSVGEDVIIHWVLESDNPCPDCRLLNRYSPYTVDNLPTVPKQGVTRCLWRCYCSLKIVKSSRKDVQRLRSKSRTAKWVLDQIKKNRRRKTG